MPVTNSEGIQVSAVEETTQAAVPPPTTDWLALESDAIGDPGPMYKKLARSPFTRHRQLRRPIVVGMDAGLSLDMDVIKDHIDFFGEAMFMSAFKHSSSVAGITQSKHRPTSVGATGYDVAAMGGAWPDGTLIKALGWANEANNGLKKLAGTSTNILVKTPGLVVEASNPGNAIIEFAGMEGATGDFRLDVDGNWTSAAVNLTTLGLNVGQWVYFPHQDEVVDINAFANDAYYGFAQITAIAAGKVSFRRRTWTVGAADAGGGKNIQVFFTKWIRNVARSHADERIRSHTFEVSYPGLAAGPVDAYEYLRGYMLNEWKWNIPSENKASATVSFIGNTATDPLTARATGPSTARDPVSGLAIGTSSDVTRLSVDDVDETGLLTDFEDLTITLKHNIDPAKAIGTMGNRFTPLGAFEAEIAAKVYFADPEIVIAVRDNRIARLACAMRNDDFGCLLDIPSMGVMETPKDISHNKLVMLNAKIGGFMDGVGLYTCGLSVFAHLPVATVTTENT